MQRTSEGIFISELTANGILSFAPNSAALPLRRLNVLVGPNGAGKSNFIEMFELLASAPSDLAGAIRDGGGVREWLWKGSSNVSQSGKLDLKVMLREARTPLRYLLEFAPLGERLEILDERLEQIESRSISREDVYFYYRFQNGHPAINIRNKGKIVARKLNREFLSTQQSVLSQRKDPEAYPEISGLGRELSRIFTFREWRFGRYGALRVAQPADLQEDKLLPDAQNLGLILNQIEHSDIGNRLNGILGRFLPRFRHISTKVQSGKIQIFLHEEGLNSPVPATRLSDGTIRFIALLAILLKPELSSLICIEEPELGLHPDAMYLLSQLIQEASLKTQMVVTTHSETLLSELSAHVEDVIVCENVIGKTSLFRLDKDRLEYWLDKYTLGEIWRSGELGGNL